ncbi:helix-turn-helix domain-containing protein [Deminuibacter soli]|nr:AraC family transcriptional regulator [Deminuibacter soli]
MFIRVPSCFKGVTSYQTLQLKDITLVEYKALQESKQVDVLFAEHTLAFVLEGEKRMHTPSGEWIIKPGEAVLIRRGCYGMSEIFTGNEGYKSLVFFLNDAIIKSFAEEYKSLLPAPGIEQTPDFTIFPASVKLQDVAHGVIHYFSENRQLLEHLLPLKFKELLLHILQEDTSGAFKKLLCSLHAERKVALEQLMEQHWQKNLTLDEWAMLSGRSLSTFKRDFALCFDTTPNQWLQQKKLQHAYFLLQHSDKTIAEIAYEIGFESVSHFIKIFRKKYNDTPNSLRTETVIH